TIGLGFASLLLIMAGLIGLAIREFSVANAQRRTISRSLLVAELADRVALYVARSDAGLRDFILTRSPFPRQATLAVRQAAREAAVERRRESLPLPDTRSQVDALLTAADAWDQQIGRALDYATRLRGESALVFQRQYLSDSVNAVYTCAQTLEQQLT